MLFAQPKVTQYKWGSTEFLSPQRRSVIEYSAREFPAVLAAGGDSVVEVSVGLLPRLVDPPGRVRLAEEEALRPDPLVRPDASPTVRDLGGVCGGK